MGEDTGAFSGEGRDAGIDCRACQESQWGLCDEHFMEGNPPGSLAAMEGVFVPRELFDFLMGNGEIDGTSFGDLNEAMPGRF